jgi:hypothetical protein
MAKTSLCNTLQQWPVAAGLLDGRILASPTGSYLAGDEVLYSTYFYRNWAQDATNMTEFSKRLKIIFNSRWESTLNISNSTRSSVVNVPDRDEKGQLLTGMNSAQVDVTKSEKVYSADRAWCKALILRFFLAAVCSSGIGSPRFDYSTGAFGVCELTDARQPVFSSSHLWVNT